MKQINLSEELNENLQDFLVNFERYITENILTNILCNLYYLDCNRECNYSKMQASEVIKIYHEALAKIEKEYNFDLASEVGF